MQKSKPISEVLEKNQQAIQPLMRLGVKPGDIVEMDFTSNNASLKNLDVSDTGQFVKYMESLLEDYKKIGVGGYGEDRWIYRRSTLFDGEKESRSIHLGVDIWVPDGTKVYAPLDATVHSFDNNDNYGDYGATIILTHRLDGVEFHTLYGHLGTSSLDGLYKGKEINGGSAFASVGPPEENGHWPPHLHFQLIADMLGREGDFFGVAPPSEKQFFMDLCPNPGWLMQIV